MFVLRRIVAFCFLNAPPCLQTKEVKDQLFANNKLAAEAGVIGVPSYQIGTRPCSGCAVIADQTALLAGDELLWGQDRLDVVMDLCCGWQPSAPRAEAKASGSSHGGKAGGGSGSGRGVKAQGASMTFRAHSRAPAAALIGPVQQLTAKL